MPTGEWGRPAKTGRRRAANGVPAGDPDYIGAPPPPPAVVVRPSRWGWIRRRPGGAVLELVLAALVVAAVVLASGGPTGGSATASGSSSTAVGSSPASVWTARAQPVLTALVDDLAAVDAATRTGGAAGAAGAVGAAGAAGQAAAIGAAGATLKADDTRAKGLGSPGGLLASSWTALLGQVDGLASTLDTSSTGLSAVQVRQIRSETESAANALVAFVAMLDRARS